MDDTHLHKLTSTLDHWFRFWMPYLFQKMDHPKIKHFYLPLNRNYKPLGAVSKDWVEYEAFQFSNGVAFSSDPAQIRDIWLPGKNTELLYLYDDTTESRRDYFKRFERLMARSIKIQKS